jgi:putative endonuclease
MLPFFIIFIHCSGYFLIMGSFFVYIIYSGEIDRFYEGYTTDIESRLHQHRIHVFKESYTKKSEDWGIFFLIKCRSKTQAMSIERHIKTKILHKTKTSAFD